MRTSWSGLVAIVCTLLGASGCGVAPDSELAASTNEAVTNPPPVGGSWSFFNNSPPPASTCLLLTNGDVMCQDGNQWHRLRPDVLGSYKNGTWDNPAIPAMPLANDPRNNCVNCIYSPLYYASAVLKDGRVVVIGGEYNQGIGAETNIGFIYDPVANSWSAQLQEVFGSLGDSQGMVLQDGTFAVLHNGSTNLEVLNPATGAFTAKNPTGKRDNNSEENPAPLYDGTLLAVDSAIAASFERYNPTTNTWGNAGTMPVNLADTGPGSGGSIELGPCALRPDSQVVCFSGNPSGQNALYNPATNAWSHAATMDFPLSPDGVNHFAMADGPAAALPNGNVLALADVVTTTYAYNAPSHFYELSLTGNALSAVADTPSLSNAVAYNGRLLVLPTGEVLFTGIDTMLYTASGGPSDAWRPAVTSAPSSVSPNGSYTVSGRLFNGFSEGASYGDDAQSSTNYPLVRIKNSATGHVFYARTGNHSRMGVEPVGSTTVVTTNFQVPANIEGGASTLEVVANGIASLPAALTVSVSTLTALPRAGWVASASNTSGGDVPANALDGNAGTRYSSGVVQSNASTHTFTVDMLNPQTFSQITLDSGADYARNYQVFASTDGTNWGTAIASGSSTTALTTITFSALTARYLQVRQLTAAGVGAWWSISEFNVYGSGSSNTGGSALPRAGWVLTASSTGGADVVANAIDGSAASRWSSGIPQSNATTQTLTIDMLSAQAFDKITLDSAGDYARNYQVFASNTTANWGTAIATGAGATGTTTITFAQQNVRYIQIRQTTSAGIGAWWSIYELNVYSPANSAPTALPRSGWAATASSTALSPSLALDGASNTRWATSAAQVNGQFYQVDMLTNQTFRQITLDTTASAGDYPRGYQVLVSTNGTTWSAPVASGTPTAPVVTITFAPQTARFIKVVQTGTVSPNWWSLYEFNVYN
jgi:hypothetical protein